jgi:hypothetical protein
MTQTKTQPQRPELEDAIRQLVLDRVKAINTKILTRLQTAASDLDMAAHRAALGGIDGIEREIGTMRTFLLLLSQE